MQPLWTSFKWMEITFRFSILSSRRFFQKNKFGFLSKGTMIVSFCSFFGRIQGCKKSFRNWFTFKLFKIIQRKAIRFVNSVCSIFSLWKQGPCADTVRPVVPGCAEGAMAHPDFSRSVKPISTRGDKSCPPNYYWYTRICRPSDGPDYLQNEWSLGTSLFT